MAVKIVRESPFSELIDSMPKDNQRELLDHLIKTPGFSTDDETFNKIFTLMGGYKQFYLVVDRLTNISDKLAKDLRSTYLEHREELANSSAEQLLEAKKAHAEFIEKADLKLEAIGKLARKQIANSSASSSQSQLPIGVAIGAAIGMVAMAALSYFVLYPSQLAAARGADEPILSWLKTKDGQILGRSFASGNTSVQNCIKRAGPSPGKKVNCQIQLN